MTRILLVDDNATLRLGLTAMLEAAGMTVVGHCADGAQVVDAFRDEDPDVVLMDLAMSGMNGVEATRRLISEVPSARVLVLTASMAAVPSALSAGARGYLLKGADPDDLVAAVRTTARCGRAR